MNRRAALTIVVLVALYAALRIARGRSVGTIDYQGQQIKLAKFYLSYEDYKDDPNNIDPSEYARVETLAKNAPIGRHFKDLLAAVTAVDEIKFPGYGSGGFGERRPDGDATLAGFSVEIPRSEYGRIFVFRCAADGCTLLDDFVSPGADQLADFKREGSNLVYISRNGERKLVRPIR